MSTVSGISTGFFTSASPGKTTELASSISSGAATVPLNSTSGYADGDWVSFIVDPDDALKKQAFHGQISGTSVINVTWTTGTNQAHTAGATVVDYIGSTHHDLLTKGLLVAFNQDGTTKAPIVTRTSTDTLTNKTLTSPTITGPTISGTVTGQVIGAANLATSALKLGYAAITANVTTTSTSMVALTGLTAAVTVPAGGRGVKITAFVGELYSSSANGITRMSIWDGTVGSGTQLAQSGQTGPQNIPSTGFCVAYVTPSAGAKTYNVGFMTTAAGTATAQASATEPAFILVEAV